MQQLFVGKVDEAAIQAGQDRLERGEHPTWCHLEWCTVKLDGSGYHQTEPIVIAPESEAEPDAVLATVKTSPYSETPVLHLVTNHPKDVNGYCGVPDEPELTIMSIRQARNLMGGLSTLLSRPGL